MVRLLALPTLSLLILPACAQDGFVPLLDAADISPAVVRPGGRVSITFRFRNGGALRAPSDYMVFCHIEDPDKGCNDIQIHLDHPCLEPVPFWQPGGTVIDGPLVVPIPDDMTPGVRNVHVGLYDQQGDGHRLLDVVAGTITVDPKAATSGPAGPAPLPAGEAARRRQALVDRLQNPLVLQADTFRYSIDPTSGAWAMTDLRGGVTWTSSPLQARFGRLFVRHGNRLEPVVITGLQPVEPLDQVKRRLILQQRLVLPDGTATGLTLRLTLAIDDAPPGGLKVTYETTGTSDWRVDRIWPLESALPVTEVDAGRTIDPYRLGRETVAADGLPVGLKGLTYSGATMQMLSVEQSGAVMLVTWDGVDVSYGVQKLWLDDPSVPGHRAIFHTLELSNTARSLTLHPLGKGTYVEAARAYRNVAARHGWRLTRADYAKAHPNVEAMAGAADFKPFVLSRTIPGSRYNSSGKDEAHLGYTFDQAAELAEHWHGDLAIDKAMVVLAGWIHRGYDNQHPDILPAAPECGGDEGLQRASERIRNCGFLFGLHDNYQDMYEDAPSWSEAMLRKGPDGKPLMGGNWAGGQAWQVRPQSQVELAERNLPEVVKLFHPTIYFIDTVFAWGLVDSQFPQDRWDRSVDLEYKSKLCQHAREQMGAFGSEEGREWAVPVADYLEGLLGHKYDTAPGEVRPIFQMTYHDCVSTYTHQGVRLGPDDDKHVLDTLIYGEMPLYSFSGPRYWENQASSGLPMTISAEVKPAGPRSFDITYTWHVVGDPAGAPAAAVCFVHFTHPKGEREGIIFQNDHPVQPPVAEWTAGRTFTDGPHRVEVPEGELGSYRVQLGVTAQGSRVPLAMRSSGGGRYWVGTVNVAQDGITFEPHDASGLSQPFARPDGWAKDMCPTDRFIKNTYEVFSWVNRLTFNATFDDHEVDGEVERTRFSNGLRIVCNYGAEPVDVPTGGVAGAVRLGQFGFVAWSPEFVAAHALQVDGHAYPTPVLFTARSLDGKPLAESGQVRIYHGFGGPEIALGGKTVKVEREQVVALR